MATRSAPEPAARRRFADKAVLVTGSSRGIGLATARAFLDEGAAVAINGRSAGSVARGVEALGGGERVHAVPGDLGSVAACEDVVGRATELLGGLDVLVNNAGVYHIASIEETDERLWDQTVDINLKSLFFCTRAAVPTLRASTGSIANIASGAGLVGFAGRSAYCAAKGGVVNLTRALALELAPEVRVNSVCTSVIDTDMGRQNLDGSKAPDEALRALEAARPLRRIAAPEEVAAAVLYLASPDARYITGTALTLDGGLTAGR